MKLRRTSLGFALCATVTAASVALIFLFAPKIVLAHGARPPGGVSYGHSRDTPAGRIPDAIITGRNAKPLGGGLVELKFFQLAGFRDGLTNETQIIALAPECRVDVEKGIASDPGPIQIYTPTTNLFIQGLGYFCAESNQVLIISNQVETRVLESLLRAPFLPAAKTNAAQESGQLLKIFADYGQFDYRSNLVNYAGNVMAQDPQFQMNSPFLSIQFTNQQVAEVLAWGHVTLTMTNKGTATGDTATYFGTNGTQLLELAGHAEWHNGEQSASAGKFSYDPNLHFLTAHDAVQVHWPITGTNMAAPVLFRELFADEATLQISPDGQLVDAMTAEGNVIIANQADQSRSRAAHAHYNRTNDLMELTGKADWWNEEMEVWGDNLAVAPSNQVYHARGHARMKRHISGASDASGHSTNQWLNITADEIVKETNLVTFRGKVEARLLNGEEAQDTLTAKLLLVTLDSSNQIQTLSARGDVHAETAVDLKGVKKTIVCGDLEARFWPGGSLLRDIIATEGVVMESSGSGLGMATNHLTAERVTANFSSVTNQMESALADGSVIFHQVKDSHTIQATGDHGLYLAAPEEQVELTGHPWGENEKYAVADADRLIWMTQSGEFKIQGRYHINPTANARRAP